MAGDRSFYTSQYNFSAGELSPLMGVRADTEIFYKGLRKAENVISIPQGGLRRRFGTIFNAEIPNITNYNQVKFFAFQYSSTIKYLIVFVPAFIYIYRGGSLLAAVASPYTASQIIEVQATQNLATMIITHPDVITKRLIRGTSDIDWTLSNLPFRNIPTYDFNQDYDSDTFVLAAMTGNGISLTDTNGVFTPEHVGGVFQAFPGLAQIITYVDPTHVVVNILVDFKYVTYRGTVVILTVPAFSDTRGWPASCTFYESRLFFGGTRTLPNGLFGSILNDYFNFLAGFGLATDALIFLLAGQRVNTIQSLLNAVSLFVCTSGGLYATSPLNDAALTPATARISQQTSTGAVANVPMLFIDNKVLYAQRGGRDIIGMKYAIQQSSYQTNSESLTAEHLIKNPVDMAKLEHAIQDQGNYVFICNSDGTLTIYQTIDSQNIGSWNPQITDGLFRRCVGLDEEVYFLIERNINGVPKFYVEQLGFTNLLDCTYLKDYDNPTNIITGLRYLESKRVEVIADGNYLGNFVVYAGQIVLNTYVTSVQVGLLFVPVVIPMPINVQTDIGNNLFYKKNIAHIILALHNSYSVTVNGSPVPPTIVGNYILGSAPEESSQLYKYTSVSGWNALQGNVISQDRPFPFTLLGFSQKVDVTT